VKCAVEQDSKDKAPTAEQKLQKYTITIHQTEIKIKNNICITQTQDSPKKSIVLMQRLNLGRDEKSVW